ncbi:Hypothetical protein MVR_LOCUS308 [uncultured virus]|nr:Hypothetical protein MVR_LOCUS308 [uncultured virus]
MPKHKYKFLYETPDDAGPLDYHHNPNIVNASASIFRKLARHDEVVCCAQMQSGKTDVMKRLIYTASKHGPALAKMGVCIAKSNIYLIICASSINLKNQLKAKLPEIRNHIYHLNDIIAFRSGTIEYEHEHTLELMATSSLVIFDECHCDAQQQSLIAVFRETLKGIAKANSSTFSRVGFSATPYEQIVAGYSKVIMEPAPSYYGLIEMFETWSSSSTPVIFQAKNLVDKQECRNLFTEIAICNYYYIFRLPNKLDAMDTAISNIESEFKTRGARIDSYVYDMSYRENINVLLQTKPIKPTLIYLKDKLRMGEYLNTEHIYMVHDDPINQFAHTTAQSLVGRCCGYGKASHSTIIYCDYEKARQHYLWIKGGYAVRKIPANAKYIDHSTGTTKARCIF